VHLVANTVVKSVEDVLPGGDGEDSGYVGGGSSELEVIVDSFFEESESCGLDVLKLLKFKLILILVKTLINHSHNTQIIRVIRVTELSLVEGRTELQRDIILGGTQKKELADEEQIEQRYQDQEEADDPLVEPTLTVSSPVPDDSLVTLVLLGLQEGSDLHEAVVVEVHVLEEVLDVLELLEDIDPWEGSAECQYLLLSACVELLKWDDQEGHDTANDNTAKDTDIELLKYVLHFVDSHRVNLPREQIQLGAYLHEIHRKEVLCLHQIRVEIKSSIRKFIGMLQQEFHTVQELFFVLRLELDVVDVEGVRAEDVGCFLILLD